MACRPTWICSSLVMPEAEPGSGNSGAEVAANNQFGCEMSNANSIASTRVTDERCFMVSRFQRGAPMLYEMRYRIIQDAFWQAPGTKQLESCGFPILHHSR